MKRVTMGVLLAVLLLPCLAFAQHELFIPPPTQAGEYLNEAIAADTLADGSRVDPERVYVLQRGGVYVVASSIRNPNWTLRIKAHDSTGVRPIIYLIRNPNTGTNPGRFIFVHGDIWIKNLMVSGYLEPDIDTATFATMNGALITVNTAGWDIEIDSCLLTNSTGNHIRTDAAPRTIKVTNTVFANMGSLRTSNLGAGKAIDLRAGSCDTLLMQNCTFVNYQDRIIRHYASTAPLRYLKFDHNTVVNGMSYHGTFVLGWVGVKMEITNNLLIDPFALGNDTDAVRQSEFGESGEKDAFGGNRMTWVIAMPNDSTQYVVSNNYYSVSPEGQAWLTANGLTEAAPLTYHINGKLGADSATAFIKEGITLGDIPALMTTFMDWYRLPTGGNKTKLVAGFPPTPVPWSRGVDFDRRPLKYFDDTLDCSYSTGTAAYTGGMLGYPVGDLNWFPAKYTEWVNDPAVDVAEPQGLPASFMLHQNYPNPFNPSTRIVYSVPFDAPVTLEVYDLLGRKVAVLVNERKQAGEYTVEFNATSMSTGVYIYRLSSPTVSFARTMLLLK
jgi:hypothetical protein